MISTPDQGQLKALQGKRLVWATASLEQGCRTRLSLSFGNAGLAVWVHPETDEVEVAWQNPCQREGELCREFDAYVGKRLGWAWSGRNDRGYRDIFLLAFEETVVPEIALVAIASQIEVRLLSVPDRRIERATLSHKPADVSDILR